jgi:hypothetical protein
MTPRAPCCRTPAEVWKAIEEVVPRERLVGLEVTRPAGQPCETRVVDAGVPPRCLSWYERHLRQALRGYFQVAANATVGDSRDARTAG